MEEGLELKMAGKAVSSLAQQEEKERRGRVETFLGLSSSNRQLPIGDNHSGSLESAHQEVSLIQNKPLKILRRRILGQFWENIID